MRRLTPLLLTLLAATGCTRQHFRERADKDVAGLLTQKNVFPDWKIENWHVYPNAEARYADPSSPDKPPFPPDDYAAKVLSPNPQRPTKHAGTGRYEGTGYIDRLTGWDAVNRATEQAERDAEKKAEPAQTGKPEATPEQAAAALTGGYVFAMKQDAPPYRLTIDQAVELAVLNSREFQDRREDLYLAALPVTQERFSFAAQAFASETAVRSWAGRDLSDAGGRWNFALDSGISRFFPTGAQLLVSFANQVVVDLSSPRPDIAISNLSLTFVQPLLRGGGFAVTLEALTQAERTLVYAIRSYARFRKVFYVALAGQGDYTNNPYGLQGLSANLGRGIGNNLTAPRAGYLPTLLRAANLANDRKNIAALEQLRLLFENLKEGGGVSELQVVRVEQQLLRGQATYLANTRQYLDQLDSFKLQLGVPTNMPVDLDDGPLKPVRRQLQQFEKVYADLRALQDAGAAAFDAKDNADVVRAKWRKLLTESSLARGTSFSKEFPAQADALAKQAPEFLAKRTAELQDARDKLLDARAERQLKSVPDSEQDLAALESLDSELDRIELEKALRAYAGAPWLRSAPDRRTVEQAAGYRRIADAGLLVAIRARNQRLGTIRAEWPVPPAFTATGQDLLKLPLDEAGTAVAEAALTNRLDLMNARAQVVDSYRQLAVTANALQGAFDVRYDLNTGSPADGSDGGALGGSRTRHAVTLRTDLPFVRRAERNQHRAALIAYQRQRRTLMAYEDNIVADARLDLRNMRAAAETYRLQCRAVELAYAQVDNARGTLLAPPDPQSREAAGGVAALTEQLLTAQSALVQAQNDLYTAWIGYLNARMELALDLELLPLDSRGVWNDDLSGLSLPLAAVRP